MDWIQGYLAVILTLYIAIAMGVHGDIKEGRYDFRISFVSLLLGIPYYGRVFGWW